MTLENWLIAALAIFCMGLAKGGFGAMSMLMMPLMVLVMPPTEAAAVTLPILIAMDMIALWRFRGTWSRSHLKIILPFACLGIAIGTLSFKYIDEQGLKLMLGLICLGFIGLYVWGKIKGGVQKNASNTEGAFWSTLAGFASFSTHAGGPPLSVYLLRQGLAPINLIGTTTIFFVVVNLVKLVPYYMLGLFSLEGVGKSLWLLPVAPVGILLGHWLLQRFETERFYKLSYAMLAVIGVKLIADAITGG